MLPKKMRKQATKAIIISKVSLTLNKLEKLNLIGILPSPYL